MAGTGPAATLETKSLILRPLVPGHLLVLLEQPEEFEASTGFSAATGLREMFAAGEVSPEWLAALRASRDPDPWRHGFFMVAREAGTVVGMAGFKGPPDSGATEIAYGVAPGFEGRGYATEAAAALVSFAFASPGVERVLAHTLPLANASTRVLTKCGFRHVGPVVDPDDGPVWRWELARH